MPNHDHQLELDRESKHLRKLQAELQVACNRVAWLRAEVERTRERLAELHRERVAG